MNSQSLLRVLSVAIVVLLAVLLLGGVLQIAGFVLSLGFETLLVLLLLAIGVRFYGIIKNKR